ncbi:MAG: DUF1353 domain-containing protein [Acidimicrobiia bacterium]|nr:DUF1353 domain-containing protein [Acidimicrobiia bacterium]
MGYFPLQLVVCPCVDGTSWVLADSFEFQYRRSGQIERIVVPRGFETDFASVPLPFRGVLPPWGKYGYASVIHDWMYWDQSLSRAAADRVLLEGMRTLNVWPPVRWTIYCGVRLFGRDAWARNSEDKSRGLNRQRSELPNDQPATTSFIAPRPSSVRPHWRNPSAAAPILIGRRRQQRN